MPARRLWAIEYVIHGEKRRETCFDVEGFEVVCDYEQNRPLTCSVLAQSEPTAPPACFLDAVVTCPDPVSDEYRSEISRIEPNVPFC
jgi:hypothetical protein